MSALTGVYVGSRTLDVLAADPAVAPATVTVAADRPSRAITVTLQVRGLSPVVLTGTYAETGTISVGNALGTSGLGIEIIVDPLGTIRGAYVSTDRDNPEAVLSGAVEGTLTSEVFFLTLVEPQEGGLRVEYRTFRDDEGR